MRKLALTMVLLCCMTGMLLCCCAEGQTKPESVFIENEWNYVDGSIDPSGGIPENTEGKLVAIRDAGVLRVATEPYYPPQEFIDPSKEGQAQYVGADMELARLIAERMGVELEIVPMEFSNVLISLEEDECDLVISGLAYTPARASRVTLSKGYHYTKGTASTGLLINTSNADWIKSTKDLRGQDIVAQSGSLQELLIAESVFIYHQFQRLQTIQDVYDFIEEGKAVAAPVDIETAKAYIEDHPNLLLVPDVYFYLEEQFDGDRVAAKRGQYQLIYFVNGVIDEVVESGQYEEWFEAYGQAYDDLTAGSGEK